MWEYSSVFIHIAPSTFILFFSYLIDQFIMNCAFYFRKPVSIQLCILIMYALKCLKFGKSPLKYCSTLSHSVDYFRLYKIIMLFKLNFFTYILFTNIICLHILISTARNLLLDTLIFLLDEVYVMTGGYKYIYDQIYC